MSAGDTGGTRGHDVHGNCVLALRVWQEVNYCIRLRLQFSLEELSGALLNHDLICYSTAGVVLAAFFGTAPGLTLLLSSPETALHQ